MQKKENYLHVLVVEDNMINQKIMRAFCENWDMNVPLRTMVQKRLICIRLVLTVF